MGLQDCFQDFHWTITISDGLWEAYHLPMEMENKAYWALKFLNFDDSLSDEKWRLQLLELEEIRLNAYESSKIYKQKMKVYHD